MGWWRKLPRRAPTDRPFWWYPLWALPLPEALIAAVFWLVRRTHLAENPAELTASTPSGHYLSLQVWVGCAFIALMISLIAPVFPANSYLPELVLLGYTAVAFLVGVYFRTWGTGVEIGLGLMAYSGRATLIAGVSLLVRRLLLQIRLRGSVGS